jgi:FtsZ-interacting cell division protein ZipA
MNKLQSIITVIAVALAILMFTGLLNPYKKKYLTELKAVREASEAREDSLKTVVLSLDN